MLPAETQQALLEQAGGNPLYAEEFVRLFATEEELVGEAEVPDSVQALIAARLDTLSPERKKLLQDAAVLGKVFWAGVLAEMAGREAGEIELALHELARKELVRRARTSSMEGETEYGFWHLLVREVCYAQIPRAARAARHRAAAAWIEGKAGGRAEDLADVLAHHYLQALALARASGQAEDTPELETKALRYLALAGERALALDVASAEQSLAKALELAPVGHGERAFLLERWAQAAHQQNRLEEAREALEEALARYREQGEGVAAGRVLTDLAGVLRRLGAPGQEEALAEALALLEAQEPGRELVAAYAQLSGIRYVAGASAEAIAAGERALALAAELGLPEPARALGSRGSARAHLGERQGLDDLRRALSARDRARPGSRRRDPAQQPRARQLAVRGAAGRARGLPGGDRLLRAARHHRIRARDCRHERDLPRRSRPLRAGTRGSRAARGTDGNRRRVLFTEPRSLQLRLLAERGAHEHAPAADDLVAAARESVEPQLSAVAFAAGARLLLAQGRPQQANALLVELEHVAGTRSDPYYAFFLPELIRTAHALGQRELSARLVDGVEPVTPLFENALSSCRAQFAEAAGEHAGAAALYAEAAKRWVSSGACPSAPMPCSARDAASRLSASPMRRRRCARHTSSSRRWATGPRSRRPRRCSPEAKPPPCRRRRTRAGRWLGVGWLSCSRSHDSDEWRHAPGREMRRSSGCPRRVPGWIHRRIRGRRADARAS